MQVEEIQRSRLLAAAAVVIDEDGYEQTSVQRITDRARVSRRTFYELFVNREECLVALLDEAAERVGGSWRRRAWRVLRGVSGCGAACG